MSGILARSLACAVLVVLAGGALAAAAPDVDCQCRDPTGTRRDLGTVTCVAIGAKRYLVRCEMSTNTPYWRRVEAGTGCLLVS